MEAHEESALEAHLEAEADARAERIAYEESLPTPDDDPPDTRPIASWVDDHGADVELYAEIASGTILVLGICEPGGEDGRHIDGMVRIALEGHADKLLIPLLESLKRDLRAMEADGRMLTAASAVDAVDFVIRHLGLVFGWMVEDRAGGALDADVPEEAF